ncbi:MAG: N-acetylmuramoyl-L-alanine amidase [Streptosporangiaceae bacterium]
MRVMLRAGAVAGLLTAALCAGCGAAPSAAPRPAAARSPAAPAATGGTGSAFPPEGSSGAGSGTSATPTPSASVLPLAGKVVGIDPGHNGRNRDAPDIIDRQVWNGREYEDCDTTGTQTAAGYTEAQFNFNVASDLRADLIAEGARVVMTRHSNDGIGPCVTTRAEIIDRSHANVAIDIHADGGPVSGRGFTVLEPVADGPNDSVIRSSARFGGDVRAALLAGTSMPESDYYGQDGLIDRDDLAGLNLTTVPKVLVECGNMPNPADAALLTEPAFQRELARALAVAIVQFLTGGQAGSGA